MTQPTVTGKLMNALDSIERISGRLTRNDRIRLDGAHTYIKDAIALIERENKTDQTAGRCRLFEGSLCVHAECAK